MPRFPDSARTIPEALSYYTNRIIQLLADGWSWDGSYVDLGWGIEVTFRSPWLGEEHKSVYVLQEHTGQGHLTRWFESNRHVPFVTMDRCSKMRDWLNHRGINYTLAAPNYVEWEEYKAIERAYGDKRTERSKQYLMNHIDEGLYLLRQYGASEWVQRAYCLHPLFQDDRDLATYYQHVADLNPRAVVLAMEYRWIANSYLSGHEPKPPSEIDFGPLSEEMRLLLMADKIQNRKDKELYNPGLPNSERLDAYYQEWFDALGISEEEYLTMAFRIQSSTGRPINIVHAAMAVATTPDRRVLMLQRPSGVWCLPGGKLEGDETHLECLKREYQEETGLPLESHFFLSHKMFLSPQLTHNRVFRLYPYRVLVPAEQETQVVLSSEHISHAWMKPEEALNLKLAGNVTRELLKSI